MVSGSQNFDENGQIVTTHAAFGKFIKHEVYIVNWREPKNNFLWNSGSETTPIKTPNDPCPTGWRVPTKTELNKLEQTDYVSREWTTENGINGCRFTDIVSSNSLFLPAAGYRFYRNGSLGDVGIYGSYWSSTPGNTSAYGFYFGNDFSSVDDGTLAYGFSVRCVAEQ